MPATYHTPCRHTPDQRRQRTIPPLLPPLEAVAVREVGQRLAQRERELLGVELAAEQDGEQLERGDRLGRRGVERGEPLDVVGGQRVEARVQAPERQAVGRQHERVGGELAERVQRREEASERVRVGRQRHDRDVRGDRREHLVGGDQEGRRTRRAASACPGRGRAPDEHAERAPAEPHLVAGGERPATRRGPAARRRSSGSRCRTRGRARRPPTANRGRRTTRRRAFRRPRRPCARCGARGRSRRRCREAPRRRLRARRPGPSGRDGSA